MTCGLCLTKSENPIEIDGDEGRHFSLPLLLEKYFPFCLSKDLNYRYVCRDCLSYLHQFHDFYIRIEKVHNLQAAVCVEIKDERSLTPNPAKSVVENDSDQLDSTSQSENDSNDSLDDSKEYKFCYSY